MTKGKIAHHEQFLLLPLCFSKAVCCRYRSVRKRLHVGGLKKNYSSYRQKKILKRIVAINTYFSRGAAEASESVYMRESVKGHVQIRHVFPLFEGSNGRSNYLSDLNFNTFPHTLYRPILPPLQQTTFENIVTKGKIAQNVTF